MKSVERIQADIAFHQEVRNRCTTKKQDALAIVHRCKVTIEVVEAQWLEQQVRIAELYHRMDSLEAKLKAVR